MSNLNAPNREDRPHLHPRGLGGQLRWRRAFKSRSKQVRSDRARSPRQAAPAENLKGTLFAGGPGAAPAGARAERSHTPPSPALPEQTRGPGVGVDGGRLNPLQNVGFQIGTRGKLRIKKVPVERPFSNPNLKTLLSDHPRSRGQSRARLPNLQTPAAGHSKGAGLSK